MTENKKEQKINIELPENVADGLYSNLAIITHSHSEFVIDFVTVMPGIQKAKVKQRIILTPQHAKRLMRALQDNITKFEQHNGKITETQNSHMIPPYSGPIAEA